MTPGTLYIPLLQDVIGTNVPAFIAWTKQNKREIQRVLRSSALTALLREAWGAPAQRGDPPQYTQAERAHRHVWSAIALDLDTTIAHGAIPLLRAHAADDFIEKVRDDAIASAQRRRVDTIPTVEAGYALLLRWLGEWDHAFDTAQQATHERAEEDQARVRAARVAAPAPVVDDRPRRRSRAPALVTEPAPLSYSAGLQDALRAREGSVLDLGVKVLGPAHFKSYASVLRRAWRALGGTDAELDDRMRRGDIEILNEQGGYASGRSDGQRASIIEYVVHPWSEPE